MPVDFTDYTDPGVYIDLIDAPITSLNGVSPTVVAIVGESSGKGRRINESTLLRSLSTTKLNAKGLDPRTVKIRNRFSTTEYGNAVFGILKSKDDEDDPRLAAAKTDTELTVILSSNVPLPEGNFTIRIQDEFLLVTGTDANSTEVVLTVTRAQDSSEAADYVAGLPVNLWQPYETPENVATLSSSADEDDANLLTSELPLQASEEDDSFSLVIRTGKSIDVDDVLLIDDERVLVKTISDSAPGFRNLTVERGVQGTKVSAHGKVANVYKVSGFDYYIKMDSGANAEFDGIDDQVVIGCIPEGRLADVSGGDVVASSEMVMVSGFATDANQYAAELMTDLDNVKDKYGLPTTYYNGTTRVNSPITLAAQLAFANGARQVYTIAINPNASDKVTAFQEAIAKVADIDEVNVMVPLTAQLDMADSTVVFSTAIEFVNAQASLGKLMRTYLAYDGVYSTPSVNDYSALAETVADIRVSVVAPSRFKLSTPTGAISVGGPYAAVAVAGLQSSFDAQEPLTRKTIEPTLLFSVDEKIGVRDMVTMQSKGVLVLFNDRTRRVTVRHGLTTDMTNSYSREISVVTARDRLRDLIYDTLQTAGLLGSPITSTTPDRVVANVTGALESGKRVGLIFDYGDIKYRIPNNNPSAIEIRFAYRPTMPLNYVLIQFSVDTVNANVVFEQVYQGGVV